MGKEPAKTMISMMHRLLLAAVGMDSISGNCA
jgi:TctA family transporter